MRRLIDAPMDGWGYAELREPAPPAAPYGGLVDEICRQLAIRRGEVRAVIRVVAAAAKGRIAPFDPSLKWGDFAQWLEQEAAR
jgi:hypothetical protein